jgi:MFS family permease
MTAPLTGVRIATVFGAFAFNYFLSALLRAVVATLAPEFARELQLSAGDLGLLAGAYFLGFACMQLPRGPALDRHGARRVLLTLLVGAAAGCLGFALARNFGQMVLARLLIGVGVSASLMAPLAAFVRLLPPALQLRLNSWMLMSGSLGMVASTLPEQALWAGPWLTQVVAMDSDAAARGLFLINLSMLFSFLCWGLLMPRLVKRGLSVTRLIAWGWPIGAVVLLAVIAIGPHAGAIWLAVWCVCTSVVTLCQPAVAQAFPRESAGRALTAFNLAIFLGVLPVNGASGWRSMHWWRRAGIARRATARRWPCCWRLWWGPACGTGTIHGGAVVKLLPRADNSLHTAPTWQAC